MDREAGVEGCQDRTANEGGEHGADEASGGQKRDDGWEGDVGEKVEEDCRAGCGMVRNGGRRRRTRWGCRCC